MCTKQPTSPSETYESETVPALFGSCLMLGEDRRAQCSQFGLFPLLPPELRNKIWWHAMPAPDVVPHVWNNSKQTYSFRRPVPPILHSCREARSLYVRPQCPEPTYELLQSHENREQKVFVNWAEDTIYIRRGHDLRDFTITQLRRLRHLAMNWGLRPFWVDTAFPKGIGFIRQFPELQVLSLVVEFVQPVLDFEEPSHSGQMKCKRRYLKLVAGLVLAAIGAEAGRDRAWQPPKVRAVCSSAFWETNASDQGQARSPALSLNVA